jgi:hypothetical protein
MLHFYDRATMAHALTLDLDPRLHRLLADRIGALTDDLVDFTEYLIVQPSDTEADIVRHVGFSPLIDPIDGWRFGEPRFQPSFDWVADHGGWFELIITFGSTFAYILLIEDKPGMNDLGTFCRAYSGRK